MFCTDSEGEDLPQEAFVFGDEIGQSVSSVKTAWRTACEEAPIMDLHFHDLRREFACRLLESRAELHDVRDFLGHANITTTSRYLRSTTLRLERALTLLEEHEQRLASAPRGAEARRIPGKVPHWCHTELPTHVSRDQQDAETVGLIEDVVVSPEGIEPSTNRLRVFGRAPSRRRRT